MNNFKILIYFFIRIQLYLVVILLCSSKLHASIPFPSNKFERIKIEDGLSFSTITCIIQDRIGYMWFGTYYGLNRYDGYTFNVYKNIPGNANSIKDNIVSFLFEDSNGFIWIAHAPENGLSKFNPETEKFTQFNYKPDHVGKLSCHNIAQIFQDSKKNIWICAENAINLYTEQIIDGEPVGAFKHIDITGIKGRLTRMHENRNGDLIVIAQYVYLFDTQKFTFERISKEIEPLSSTYKILSVLEDRHGSIRLGTLLRGNILLEYDIESKTYIQNNNNKINFTPNSSNVLAIDHYNKIWIASNPDGLFVYDQNTGLTTNYLNDKNNQYSISDNCLNSLYLDRFGVMWIGTSSQGLCKIDLNIKPFKHIKSGPEKENFLSGNVVSAIHSVKPGELWIGIDKGGGVNRIINYQSPDPQIIIYKHDPKNTNSIGGDNTLCLTQRKNGNVWLGSLYGSLSRIKPEVAGSGLPPQITRYQPASWTFAIYEDKSEILWGGTWGGGLWRYLDEQDAFVYYKNDKNNKHSLVDDEIWTLYEDNVGNLWIGGHGKGLSILTRGEKNKPEPKFINYSFEDNNDQSLSNNTVNTFCHDKSGIMWIGTANGLNKVINPIQDTTNLQALKFEVFHMSDGLPNEWIAGIVEDDKGYLWISTANRLCKFNKTEFSFEIYSVDDGLQSNEFWHNTQFKDFEGNLYFGGPNGFNSFHPESIKKNPHKPGVVISDIKIFNNSVQIGDTVNGDIILSKSINSTSEIQLSYKNNVLTFVFSAIQYSYPKSNQYAYKMEGFDKEWNYVGNKREATYTNMDPGEYVFKVKASNYDGIWNEEGTSIKIVVTPPFWETWWLKVFLVMFLIGIIYGLYILRVSTLEKQKVILENEVEKRTVELRNAYKDLMTLNATKDKFFSIIAHDLKNPFSSVLGFTEFLYKNWENVENNKVKKMLGHINSSANKIFHLLENLLQWSMSQMGSIKVYREAILIHALVEENFDLLKNSIQNKGNKAENKIPEKLQCYADSQMIGIVIRNLLTNANKFTESGTLTVHSETKDGIVKILIKDTGGGIPKDKLDSLFKIEKSYTTKGTRGEDGTGLGLLICKEYVQKNGGEIYAESEVGKGTTVIFTLPMTN